MTRAKSTKKALLMSVLSLLVCCAMLMGSTFAWFSDTATTGKNTITAGRLDVELEYNSAEAEADPTWTNATEAQLFDTQTKWEPGMMVYSKQIRVANKGDLYLWYSITVGNLKSTGKANLLEVVKMKVVKASAVEGKVIDTLEERQGLWKELSNSAIEAPVVAPKSESEALVVVLFWEPTDHDNDYNMNNANLTEAALTAEFTIDVFATQTPEEEDSFGKNYDANAKAQEVVHDAVANGLAEAADVLAEALVEAGVDADAIKVTPLTFIEETNAYEADFIFTDAIDSEHMEAALGAAFTAMQNKVAEALWAQKDNVTTVTLGSGERTADVDPSTATGEEDLASKLLAALGAAFDLNMISPEGKITIPVTVLDAGGVSTHYNLHFDLSQLVEG